MKYRCTICGYTHEGDINNISCPICHSNNFLEYDLYILKDLSCSDELIKAMQQLKENDIIEYELKMSQFRNQYDQKIELEMSNRRAVNNFSNVPKCPTCGSTKIQKISAGSKALGAIGFGLLSKTARSTFKCNNCGHKW